MVKKIVIIGPESTGKSTLCTMLSQHYNALWCKEYAREYLEKNGTAYTFPDLLSIAKGQLELEEKAVESSTQNLLFIDTNMYVMKVWCEYVFNDCHSWILKRIAERPYDFYLLCRPDLPWVKDDLREYPNEKPRQELYHIYKDLLVQQATPWAEVFGNYNERLERAISAINAYC